MSGALRPVVRQAKPDAARGHRLRPLVARILPVVLVVGVCFSGVGLNSSAFAATPPQLDLKILLLGEGAADPTTAAWQSALTAEGVPYDLVTASGAPGAMTVTLPPLSAGNVGHYNGVVIADNPLDYATGVLNPLFAYESAFGVRQIDGYMYPYPLLGVTASTGGPLDGKAAHLSTAGLAVLPALKGPIPFDTGSYGYSATVTPGAPYTSLIQDVSGHTMAGVYQHPSTDAQAGVAELSLHFNYNVGQLHWLLLAPGLINWVTRSTHLGLNRNYFGQDIDDVFIADNEWSSQFQCTPGATDPLDFTCPAGVAGNPADTPPDTLMSAADVAHVVAWQQQTGIRLNLAFNAVGACTGPATPPATIAAVCSGTVTDGATTYTLPGFAVDPSAPDASQLTKALLDNKAQFNWIMHTWSHAFLGCQVWAPQALTSVTAKPGGGTFAAGAQSYKITAATAYGESELSTAKTATLAAGGSATLTWPEASNGTGDTGNPGPSLALEQATHVGGTGFWGYKVYRLKSDSTYGLVGQVPEASGATAATTYSFTDTGITPAAAPDSSATDPTATNPGIGCTNAGWVSANTVKQEIGLDQAFAQANGLTTLPAGQYTQNAVVTGEHSGVENPNMPTALNAVGVTTFAQDASRQPAQYSLGNAIGAPRYPSNIYYNASNWTDQLNEYNTLYVQSGTAFPGGVGRCVNTSSTTCRTTPAGKADLLASESHIMLSHSLANNPRLGYAHQPNLIGSATAGEGYTLLDLIDSMLAQYNAWYTGPLTQVTDVSSAKILAQQTAWANAQAGGKVTASITNGVVTVSNAGTPVDVPVTAPTGTTVNGADFGDSYGGTRSGWVTIGASPLVLNENVAPAILSAAAASSIVGAPFTTTIVTSGAPAPALTASGALPAGITFLDNGNGTATIAGTAASGSGGSYPLTITATSSSGTATQAFTLTNSEAPTITSPSTATFNIGVAGTYTVTTTGFPAATITETGALPSGLSFTAAGNGTATIAGTAASTTAGSYPVTISATNSSGSTATLVVTLTVNTAAAPVITSPSSAFFTLNKAGAAGILTTGSPTPTVTETGALPAGLTFVANANGTALISGTATATGTSTLAITAANGSGPNATQTYTIVVGQAPAFTSPSAATFVAGTASSFTVATTGYPAPSIGATGLPTGLTLTTNGNGTATISGTADAAAVGARNVSLSAVNGTGTASQTLVLTVTAATAAPAAPVIGTATAGNASATVRWTAPANNGSAITGYSVKVVNSATGAQIGALRPAAATATSLLVTGLVNGTAVRFQVRATNAVGTGAFSALSAAMTPATVPSAPTIGTATAAGPTSATVTWTAATNGGSAITGYSVRVLDSSNAQVGALRPAAATATGLAVTGLTTGKAYHFTVTATNAVGTSVASANSTAVTLIVPGTPGIGLAVAGTAGGAITATANWTAPAANAGPAITAYQVVAEQLSATGTVLATTTSANQPATARTFSMTLPVAGNYRFSVRAINIVGNGALSAKSNTVAGR
jgi:hypothetical protein